MAGFDILDMMIVANLSQRGPNQFYSISLFKKPIALGYRDFYQEGYIQTRRNVNKRYPTARASLYQKSFLKNSRPQKPDAEGWMFPIEYTHLKLIRSNESGSKK
jgi:hypothetical protein